MNINYLCKLISSLLKIFILGLALLCSDLFADSISNNPNNMLPVQSMRNSGNQLSYGSSGQAVMNTQTLGTQTNYYGSNGQYLGKAQTTSNGSTVYYNPNGQISGYNLK